MNIFLLSDDEDLTAFPKHTPFQCRMGLLGYELCSELLFSVSTYKSGECYGQKHATDFRSSGMRYVVIEVNAIQLVN